MDFKALCDSITQNACVLSVERVGDGFGEIRIVAGNTGYTTSFQTETYVKHDFVPNSLYTDYLPKNLNFEDYCFRCAAKKELLHSYAYPENFKMWFHMLFIPLEYQTEKLCYCLYIMEMNQNFDPELLASPRGDIYNKVLTTTLQLANTGDFSLSLQNVAREIRKICDALFCCILLVDEHHKKLDVLAEDRDPRSAPVPIAHYVSEHFYSVVSSWKELITRNGNCMIIHDQKGMDYIKENAPEWYASLIANNIKSLVLFPLKSGDSILGYMWVSNFETDDTPKIKEALEITTFVLGAQIANRLLLDQLTQLSSVDLLTGLYNRNKLNAYMSGVAESEKRPIGLVFLDINGLKKVNDQQGHLAGDELIKRAADTLNATFDGNDIFRVGGDEFVVILKEASEEKIIALLDTLQEKADENKVSFAAGYAVADDHKDIEKALNEADFYMYKDKRKFYSRKK